MTDLHDTHSSSTPRERELAVEVARLQAELDTLRGEDPGAATSRFLEMAAATVDQAVEDARREADEIVMEISAEAEARRDEASRVAAEAEALAEQKLVEVDRAQEAVEVATEHAESIAATAKQEAAEFIATERQKLAAEAEAFAEVRASLDEERVVLGSYHEKLRVEVQELAQSMMSFMSSEIPGGSSTAIDDLLSPQLEAALTDLDGADAGTGAVVDAVSTDDEAVNDIVAVASTEQSDPLDTPAPAFEVVEAEAVADPWVGMLEAAIPETDRIVDVPTSAVGEIPASPSSRFGGAPLEDSTPAPRSGLFARIHHNHDETEAEDLDEVHDEVHDVLGAETEAETDVTGPDVPEADVTEPEDLEEDLDEVDAVLGAETGAETDVTGSDVPEPEDLDEDLDEVHAVLEAEAETGAETDVAESDVPEAETDVTESAEKAQTGRTGLFGMLGSRLVEQTPPDDLAGALDGEDSDDEAFRQFLDGDDAPDPSRDWLLRPEQR